MSPSKAFFFFLFFITAIGVYSIISPGCAQIGMPTGGPKDTLPPVLINATPPIKTINFSGNKITFTFDEYVNIDDALNNLIVSPLPKSNPVVTFKLRTVTVKLKDTLLPNTTYSLNFGKAIKDVDEGNILKNFTYVFSTGGHIDSLRLGGKVIIAETGKTDSTLMAFLYKDAVDSFVQTKKPNYIARLNGDGSFNFRYLPPGTYKLYALKDDDGSKTYNSKSEMFAFAGQDIVLPLTETTPIKLYAYVEEPEEKKPTTPSLPSKKKPEKKLRYNTSLSGANQDILGSLEIDFSQTLKDIDSQKIRLTDTSYNNLNAVLTVDSTRKIMVLNYPWKMDEYYKLIIDKDAVSDSADNHLSKTDTLLFKTKKEEDYGSLLFRFSNIDTAKHPVLLLLQQNKIVKSIPIKASQWSAKIFEPGEYDVRVLYDTNNNGKWDPGNYSEKLQPEKVISFDKKLTIKADWDNEREIKL